MALSLVTTKGFAPKECILLKALKVTELPPPVALELAFEVNATV